MVKRHFRDACPITNPATDDAIWLREVTARGWLIIGRDRAIQRKPAEIAAVRESGARMVVISSTEKIDTFRQLEVVMTQWRYVESLLDVPGPFIRAVTRTSSRSVRLS